MPQSNEYTPDKPQEHDSVTTSVMPSVIFDLNIGQAVEDIDFNYDTFYRLAKDYGISDEYIADFTIHISSKRSIINAGGRYFSGKNTARIYDLPSQIHQPRRTGFTFSSDSGSIYSQARNDELSPYQKLDIVVRHEIGHWVDDINIGEGTQILKKRRRIFGLIGACGLAATIAVPVLARDPFMAIPTALSPFAAYGAYMVRLMKEDGGSEHRHLPQEIPAYSFEANTRDYPLISLIPKQVETTH
jgi:hypothetical protein